MAVLTGIGVAEASALAGGGRTALIDAKGPSGSAVTGTKPATAVQDAASPTRPSVPTPTRGQRDAARKQDAVLDELEPERGFAGRHRWVYHKAIKAKRSCGSTDDGLRLAQAAMNHASLVSTTIYSHVDGAKLTAAVGI